MKKFDTSDHNYSTEEGFTPKESRMKINYEDIIALANQRKERLQQLEHALSGIDRIAAMLDEVACWYTKVDEAYRLLDTEGKQMLPPEVAHLIPYMKRAADIRSMVQTFQTESTGQRMYGLRALSIAIKQG